MKEKYLAFNKIDDQNTELYIYGDIRKKNIIEKWLNIPPEATDAFTLKDAINSVDTPNLIVRINSYGGDVAEGLAIYSLLSNFKGHLTTIVDGFACSAASVIFMAGETRIVPEQGLLMIHNAWSYAEGDSNTMKKMAEDLEKITQPSINIYASKTKLSEEVIKDKMDKETWITSKEAFEWGFATSIERNEAKQSLECNFVHNLVMRVKELESEIISQNKNNEVVEPQKDAWASFFRREG